MMVSQRLIEDPAGRPFAQGQPSHLGSAGKFATWKERIDFLLWGGLGVALGWLWGAFGVPLGCLCGAYQQALWWL
jgi:hypothetical protein